MAKAKSHTKAKAKEKLLPRPQFKARPLALGLIVTLLVIIGLVVVYRSLAANESMSVLPSTSNVSLGASFTVTIRENSNTTPVNAVEADLTYDQTKFQFVSIDTSGSAFNQGAVATGGGGNVQIARIITGSSGAATLTGDQLVATVTFTAIGTGATAINIGTGSAVVRASDNTNVLTIKNNGAYTIADTTPPNAPTGLTVGTRTVSSIAMSWTAPTDNVGVTGYKVFRNGTLVNSNVSTTSFTDTGLSPGTNYSYTIIAFDAAGNNSSASTALATSTLPDTSAPTVPTGLTVGTRTVNSIAFSWAGSTDNVAVTGYNILRNGTKVGTSATASYTDTGLTPNTAYSYTVQAFDAVPNTSASSTALATSTLPDTTAPSTPTGLLSPSQSTNSISLTWSASTDNVGVTGYKVLRNGTLINGNVATTSFTDTGLTQGTAYSYTIQAFDAAGNVSTSSAASSFSTKSKPGDVNSDGFVNATDLSILASHYNQSGNFSQGDLNNSGVIDIFDLSILASYWGT